MGFQFFLRNKTFWTFSTGKLLFLHVSLKSVPGQVLHLSRAFSHISDVIFKETCVGQYGHWRRSTWNLLLCNFSLCFPLKCFSHRSHLTGSSKSKQSFVWLLDRLLFCSHFHIYHIETLAPHCALPCEPIRGPFS